ncbi:MAG: c-type cytochrome [Gammaproteobacteria bacterium]
MKLKSALLLSATLAVASASAVAAPASYKKCASCHGDNGAGLKGNPAIQGLSAEAAKAALVEYKTGVRKHPIMNMMTKGLKDAQIDELASFIATLK